MRKLCLQMNLVVWVFSKKCLQMIEEPLLVYTSQLDLEYDGDKLFNDLKTRQAILKSTVFVLATNAII